MILIGVIILVFIFVIQNSPSSKDTSALSIQTYALLGPSVLFGLVVLLLSLKYSVLAEFVHFTLFLTQIIMMVYLNIGALLDEEMKTTQMRQNNIFILYSSYTACVLFIPGTWRYGFFSRLPLLIFIYIFNIWLRSEKDNISYAASSVFTLLFVGVLELASYLQAKSKAQLFQKIKQVQQQ